MLAPLLALALMQKVDSRPFTTGADLYSECKSWVAMVDGTRPMTSGEDYGAGACLGYIDGLSAGLMTLQIACVGDASIGTLIRVYLVYVDKNPRVLDFAASAGVNGALREAYPCPAHKK